MLGVLILDKEDWLLPENGPGLAHSMRVRGNGRGCSHGGSGSGSGHGVGYGECYGKVVLK